MELNKRDAAFPGPTSVMKKIDTESDLDRYHLQLIQLIHLLGSAFVAPHFWRKGKAVDDTFDQLANIFADLASMPGHGSSIFICETETAEKDPKNNVARYTLQFGNYFLNKEKVAKITSRLKAPLTQQLRKLQIAFDIFSLNGIHDLYLHLPEDPKRNLEYFRISLEIISRFDQAVKSGSDIVYQGKDREIKIPVIKGQQGREDCNLTIFAALNRLSQNAMETINAKVTDYIEEHFLSSNFHGEYKIFNTLSQLKGFAEKMIFPPLEVNNCAFHLADKEAFLDPAAEATLANSLATIIEPNSRKRGGSDSIQDSVPVPAVDSETAKKGNLASVEGEDDDSRILDLTDPVIGAAGNEEIDSQQVAFNVAEKKSAESKNGKTQSFDAIDGGKRELVDDASFGVRLEEVTHLLSSLKNTENGGEILDGIIETLQSGLEKAQDGNLKDRFAEDQPYLEIVDKLNSRILTMLSRFGKRVEKKDEHLPSTQPVPNTPKFEPEKIAERFDFSIPEANNIIHLLEGCFDSKGHFFRTEFESRIPQFIAHEKSIFKFLWAYLDEPFERNDRVAFLNSLYLLVSKMKDHQKIMSFLIDEIYKKPLKISYSDRNAFILASLLLRKYNKEFSIDIEQTPGEVLLVKNGMNGDILQHTLSRIESDQQLVKDKLNMIHDRLVTALHKNKPGTVSWDPHFLLSLEREAFIFISLVSGGFARKIIVAALSEYGNPESELYKHQLRDKFISLLLQQLKLLIRSVGRVGDIEDLGILADLKKNEQKFTMMLSDTLQEKNVRQVFKMIDTAMGNITSLQ